MSLMLHCGSNAIDRAGLAALPVPQPMGPRHAIQPFINTVEAVTDNFKAIGATLKDESFGILMSPGDIPRRFFGLMEIELPDHVDGTYALQVGLRGSYDQSISNGLGVGSRVFVCDNLSFHGEVEFRTKQTTFIGNRINGLIGSAVQRIPQMAQAQSAQFERFKNTTISQHEGDAMLTEMVRRGALNPSQVGMAIREWDSPTYDEHSELGWTLWRLHNAVTMAIKQPTTQNALGNTWARTRIMNQFIDPEFAMAEAA